MRFPRVLTVSVLCSAFLAGCADPSATSGPAYGGLGSIPAVSESELYVANIAKSKHSSGDVTVYEESGRLSRTITAGIGQYPESLSTDSSGNLYVANSTENNVAVYAAGALDPEKIITEGIKRPKSLLNDASGNLYVACSQSVSVYSPGQTTPSAVITEDISNPSNMVFDADGDLYVANSKGSSKSYVTVYAAADHSYLRTLSEGMAFARSWKVGMVFDAKGNFYVANGGANTVTVYANGQDLTRTISKGIAAPYSLTMVQGRNLFVGNVGESESDISEYRAQRSFPSLVISSGVDFPTQLLQVGNNLYSVNTSASSVTKYSAKSGKLLRTYSRGMDRPSAMAFGP